MAVKSFRDANPYLIGIVSVLVLAAGVSFAFAVGVLHLFEHTYSVTAVFPDAAGIRSGDDVRVAGVKVGRVTGVQADHDHGDVKIDLAVRSGVHLGPKTGAEVALETLLGTKYVRLSGPVREPYLHDGAVIPLDRTKIPFDIFQLTKVGTRTIEQTDTKRLNELVDQLATVTEGRHDDIADLLTGLQRVSSAIEARQGQLGSLLDHVQTISGTLADKDKVLVRLLDQSKGVLDVLDARRQELGRGLAATDTLTQQLASLTAQFKSNLDDILTTVHDTVLVVDKRQADLDRALAYLGPGTLGLAKAVSHGPWADVYAVLASQDPSEGSP